MSDTTPTLDAAIRGLRDTLAAVSDTPALDARRLVEHVLGLTTAQCIGHSERPLSRSEQQRLAAAGARRAAGEPLPYITGTAGFWTLELAVDRRVLVPRPETEMLVEAALERLSQHIAHVADLGTGSGAIALALACERPEWRIEATDTDPGALACARGNAARLGVANVTFHQGSWLAPLGGLHFDAIVANPPYVDADDPHLDHPALGFEPHHALVAGDHGLADLARIVETAAPHLRTGGWLMLEHGAAQGPAVRALMRPGYAAVATLTDLAGHPRITLGQRS